MTKISTYFSFFAIAVICLFGCATRMPSDDFPAYSTIVDNKTIVELKDLAQAGDPAAEYTLGYQYYYGIGVSRDEEAAREWIAKSASQGYKRAKEAMRLIINNRRYKPDQPSLMGLSQRPTPKSGDQNPLRLKQMKSHIDLSKKTSKKSLSTLRTKNNVSKQLQIKKQFKYTIQLLSSTNKQDLFAFRDKYGLQQKSRIKESSRNKVKYYKLLYGHYSKYRYAKLALDHLPKSLRKHNPWIHQY